MTDDVILSSVDPFNEVAVDVPTFESIMNFHRSRGSSSLSFEGIIDGELVHYSLYRFVDPDTKKNDMFMHTTRNGYNAILSMDSYGNPPCKLSIKTKGMFAMMIYPVKDLEKYLIDSLIQDIMVRMISLNNHLSKDDEREMIDIAYGYVKTLHEDYK